MEGTATANFQTLKIVLLKKKKYNLCMSKIYRAGCLGFIPIQPTWSLCPWKCQHVQPFYNPLLLSTVTFVLLLKALKHCSDNKHEEHVEKAFKSNFQILQQTPVCYVCLCSYNISNAYAFCEKVAVSVALGTQTTCLALKEKHQSFTDQLCQSLKCHLLQGSDIILSSFL